MPGISVYEKSLAKDKVKEQARFRIVTLQPVVAALRFLTYDRDHGARAPSCKDFAAAQQEIDRRCPAFVSPKGSTSKTWLEQTLWVEAPALETLKQTLLFSIMIDSATDGGQALLVDQAEKLLLSLLDWVKRAGDAKFIPDKDKKIISRAQAVQWWHEHIAAERAGAHTDSGAKLRRKMQKFALLVQKELGEGVAESPDVVAETFALLLTLGHGESDARRLLDAATASGKKFKDVESLVHAVYQQRHL